LALPNNACNDIHLYRTIAWKFKGKNLKTLEFPLIQDEQENIIAIDAKLQKIAGPDWICDTLTLTTLTNFENFLNLKQCHSI
jgi:hypothetical protein